MFVFKLVSERFDAHIVETAEAVELHNTLLASMPEGAKHDSDICPFCVDKAFNTDSTASGNPPGPAGPDVSGQDSQHEVEKGGTSETMTDISQEAHEALVKKAVEEAIAATEKALLTKTEEAATATSKVGELEDEVAKLKADNDRINGELDTAQVSLKTAQDEVETLKADIAAKDEAAAKTEIASKRSEQVKTLGLFTEEYIGEKAEAWAGLSDDAWTERLDEWAKLKPAGETKTDTASAMSGTTEQLTDGDKNTDTAAEEKKPTARRAILGLPA